MSDLFKAISAIPLKAGQVVATQFDGTIALCAASVTPVGVAIATAPIGAVTDIETDGVLKLDDWNIATGFRDLSPGSTYYISNSQSGFLTTTKPTTVGQFITRIGVAVTRRALLIKLELPFEIQAVGSGSTPTGTGFRHVVSGVEDAAAKLVENADVHASAAIAESKLSLGFPTHSNALDHSNASDPSAGEKSALAGTNGTPGAGNKYVTNSDPRNTDARTPAAHTHPISEVTSLQSSLDGKAATVHVHVIGDTTGLQAALDGKASTAHATSHQSGGSDAIKLDDLAAPDDNTDLDASTAKHGLMKKFPGGTTNFLREDGAFASPGASSTNIKQTEVDFGTIPVAEKSFIITDADVSAGSQLIGNVAYEAPTGKDLDELEMDGLDLKFAPGAGQFTLFARGMDGYVADKFRINYIIG